LTLIQQAREQRQGLEEQKAVVEQQLLDYPKFAGSTPLELEFYNNGKRALQNQVDDLASLIRHKDAEILSLRKQTQTSMF